MSKLDEIRARREKQKRQRKEYLELMARGVQNLSRDEQLRARILDDSAHIIWENELDVLLDALDRQLAVIDAAKAVDDRMFTFVNVFIDSVNWSHEHTHEGRQILITPEHRQKAAQSLDKLHDALAALDAHP